MTMYVATRWYRAPELILSEGKYSEAVDVWSCGCILAELFNRKPLFKSVHNMQQLKMIIQTLGTPSPSDLASMGAQQSFAETISKIPLSEGTPFEDITPKASPEARDLISKMLTFNPVKYKH